MDNKYKLVSTVTDTTNTTTTATTTTTSAAIGQDQQQQLETLSEQNNNENFSQPAPLEPKVIVSLPKHAASRLRDLVQRRDIALLRLGIISVQFEDDQIIPLTLNNTNNSIQPTKHQPIAPSEPIIVPPIENCNADCIGVVNDTITALGDLISSDGPIIGEDLESNINPSDSHMLETSITVVATSTTTTTTSATQMATKTDCNTNDLTVVYDDDQDDDKDEDEVVSEVENQHSSYNIHQLSQLEFENPIELEMYDNDNLLFPDYTLNLS